MARVFISHQWMDKQLADRLARDLEPFADVWMDYRRLRPGEASRDCPLQGSLRQTRKPSFFMEALPPNLRDLTL